MDFSKLTQLTENKDFFLLTEIPFDLFLLNENLPSFLSRIHFVSTHRRFYTYICVIGGSSHACSSWRNHIFPSDRVGVSSWSNG